MPGSCTKLLNEWVRWARLGWFDIGSRYRRTTLGPFWITLVTALTVLALGFVYGTLFRIPDRDFVPYLTIGFIIWSWASGTFVEAGTAFSSYKSIILSQPVRPSSIVVRVVARNLIVFAHNFAVIVVVLLVYEYPMSSALFYLLPGGLLVLAFVLATSYVVALAGARYRDLNQLMNAFLGMAFLVTPVIWSPEVLAERQYIASFNPFAHLLELIRMPLLGKSPASMSWAIAAVLTSSIAVLGFALSRRGRHRLPFWL